MKIIDEHTFEGKGYHPFLITDRWQVAYLNYAEAESLEQIEKLDIHHQTDEVFILLQGKAALIGASVTDQNITYATGYSVQYPKRSMAQDRHATGEPGTHHRE